MRKLVIGDIHGGLKALKQCLERSNYNQSYDQLIFLGDYVDGWSESAELIEYLIELRNHTPISPIFLRGNHDKWCEEWLNTGVAPKVWINNGGEATVDSYFRTELLSSDSHKKFFRGLHNYYVDDQNRGFVHGGFVSRGGLGHEPNQSNYYWDRDLWNLALLLHNRRHEGEVEGSRRFEKHKEVYIGHTATVNWKCKANYPEAKYKAVGKPIDVPMNRCNVWNLDTGAGWYGKLTIMDIDTKEFWQSDLVQELYSEEKGR